MIKWQPIFKQQIRHSQLENFDNKYQKNLKQCQKMLGLWKTKLQIVLKQSQKILELEEKVIWNVSALQQQ